MTYIFFRKEGFYPIELSNDKEAIDCAVINDGTIKVEDIFGKIIWTRAEH